MRIVGQGRGSARIVRLNMPDGKLRVATGDMCRQLRWLARTDMEQQACANIVIEAAFSIERRRFIDRDSGFGYELSKTGAMEVLEAVTVGRLRVGDGRVSGLFSFRVMGGIAYLVPARDRGAPVARRFADASGVPDMTDFLKSLGGENGVARPAPGRRNPL